MTLGLDEKPIPGPSGTMSELGTNSRPRTLMMCNSSISYGFIVDTDEGERKSLDFCATLDVGGQAGAQVRDAAPKMVCLTNILQT